MLEGILLGLQTAFSIQMLLDHTGAEGTASPPTRQKILPILA